MSDTQASEWIEWKGGQCPLPPDMPVEVKFRCGETDDRVHAGAWDWRGSEGDFVIVAYRVVKP